MNYKAEFSRVVGGVRRRIWREQGFHKKSAVDVAGSVELDFIFQPELLEHVVVCESGGLIGDEALEMSDEGLVVP